MRTLFCLLQFFFIHLAFAQQLHNTAMDSYEHVQKIRATAESMIKKDASLKGVQAAADHLSTALSYLKQERVQDLAHGNHFLFYRGFDARLDLAELYVRLGQEERAWDTLAGVTAMTWEPDMKQAANARPGLQKLTKSKRFEQLDQVSKIPNRLYGEGAFTTGYQPQLSAGERIAGLSIFWNTAKDSFVYFDNVPNLDWQAVFLDFVPKVQATESTYAYYKELMKLAPLLQDGHTNIYPPKELHSKFYSRPSVRTVLIDDRVIIRDVPSPTVRKLVQVGEEIVAIDGMPVLAYAKEFVAPYVSSSTVQDRNLRTFGNRLLAGDAERPVSLKIKSATGELREVQLARKPADDLERNEAFATKNLPGNIAYIAIDHFDSEESVRAFKKFLPQILKSRALIIDVRMNGGGSSDYGLEMLSYLTDKPIRTMDSFVRAETPMGRFYFGNFVKWAPVGRGDGTYHAKRPAIFRGSVYVLVDAPTFSAAEDFAATFKMMKRGAMVGMPTGGSTGQPLSFALPGGGEARVCAKRDVYADGTTFVGRGIVPDHVVPTSIADIRAGRDAALDYTLAMIAKQR